MACKPEGIWTSWRDGFMVLNILADEGRMIWWCLLRAQYLIFPKFRTAKMLKENAHQPVIRVSGSCPWPSFTTGTATAPWQMLVPGKTFSFFYPICHVTWSWYQLCQWIDFYNCSDPKTLRKRWTICAPTLTASTTRTELRWAFTCTRPGSRVTRTLWAAIWTSWITSSPGRTSTLSQWAKAWIGSRTRCLLTKSTARPSWAVRLKHQRRARLAIVTMSIKMAMMW